MSLVEQMEAAWAEAMARPKRDTVMVSRGLLDAINEHAPAMLDGVDVWIIPEGPPVPNKWWRSEW